MMRDRSFGTVIWLCTLAWIGMAFFLPRCWSVAQEPSNAPRFIVAGQVLDDSGDPVTSSVVVPLSKWGIPLRKSTGAPVTLDSIGQFGDEDFLLFTQTDAKGRFKLQLPAGKYRIVAQSWPGKTDITQLLKRHGPRLRIDGVVEYEFSSEMEASIPIEIRPIGTGTIRVTSQESGDLVLISTEPMAGDPALGFMALTGTFWSGLIGGASMKNKELIVSGLPEGALSFSVFVNDNNGGWGGATADVIPGDNPDVYVGLLAGWSNRHRTPPPELRELTDYFLAHPDEVEKLSRWTQNLMKRYLPEASTETAPSRFQALSKLAGHLQDEYQLGDGNKVTLAEAWAAQTYYRMNR